MSQLVTFAYVQTRLQARHGNRPDERTWQRLETFKELAGYLQNARRTVLRPWVLGFHEHDDYHTLEISLIRQYRFYINEIAFWQPQQWQKAVHWLKQLPDLPALQHLLTGNTALTWMLDDPRLKLFSTTNPEQRIEYMKQSDYAPLIQAWQSGTTLTDAWVQHWQSLWHEKKSPHIQPLLQLITLLYQHLDNFRHSPLTRTWQTREILNRQLTSMFRKYNYQPVAAFIHLALVALDIERLRGDIMQRSLFVDYQETGS